jgi:hypothetical protein
LQVENPPGNESDEPWWKTETTNGIPPDDRPLLAPYEETRPGYELLVEETCIGPRDMGVFKTVQSKYLEICLWNIWEKKKDPADTDVEKRRINEMQLALNYLSDDDRYIRLQIADLERCHYTFPRNVDLILEGIASGKVCLDETISCEPPWAWMLKVLRQRRGLQMVEAAGANTRQKKVGTYTRILAAWLAESDPCALKEDLPNPIGLAETIYSRLGVPTKLKSLYILKLLYSLNFWAYPPLEQHGRWERYSDITKVFDLAIQQELEGCEDRVGRRIDRNHDSGLCHHSFFRHVDHLIAWIGSEDSVKLPGEGEERKRIHKEVTNYVHVLGSWLAGRTLEEAATIWPECEGTGQRLYDLLGDPALRKRWLVACLWKTLQENQAHHGLGALDDQPERFALPPNVLRA